MMKKLTLFLVLPLMFPGMPSVCAQELDHVLGEVLVQFKADTDVSRWTGQLQYFQGRPTDLQIADEVSRPLGVWRLTFDHVQINERQFLAAIRRRPEVQVAQFNHFADLRSTTPDDPRFNNQWQYVNTGQSGGLVGADLDADLAWDITTGGLSADGDTIVVCVIDDGVKSDHPDLVDNLWINHGEIPGNGIDDDLNGYVDDYRGWNILQDNDNLSGGSHGTSVAGIVGARGNNGIGVTGVNWQVRLMIVKNNFNTTEAAIIEAYSYPLVQRMRYNASNGQEGAFVVATNSSWGRDRAKPEDAPIWCALYDSLGTHGILSCGATANADINVDVDGDLPTSCPSDFLISVTNINKFDLKVPQAGFGVTAIDLGAYGDGTYTVNSTSSEYGTFSGTSAATPHVAGAVALLYAAPCPSLMAVAKSDPAAAALLVKQYILDGVTPIASLDGKTVTGGRLNLNTSLRVLMDNCGGCQPPTSVAPLAVRDTSADLGWIANDSIARIDLRWRLLGTTEWTLISNAQVPVHLGGLLACSGYEFQLKTYCAADTLDFSGSRIFKTDGCCEAPGLIYFSGITEKEAQATWPPVLAAGSYTVRFRVSGEEDWQEAIVEDPHFRWDTLSACVRYETQIVVHCRDGQTDAGPVFSFSTLGCGPCRELNYCAPGNLDASQEWIARVQLATLDNVSQSNGGHGVFTELEGPLLQQGESYPIRLEPGYAAGKFRENFRVWIDYNQDGVFAATELAFAPDTSTTTAVNGFIRIPAGALPGNTRMRVGMLFLGTPAPCGQIGNLFGEVEDYCINIALAESCPSPTGLDTLQLGPTSVRIKWNRINPAVNYLVRYRALNGVSWQSLTIQGDTTALLSNLQPCLDYEAQVQSRCFVGDSPLAGNLLFKTSCISAGGETLDTAWEWQAGPNPFREMLHIRWSLPSNPRGALLLGFITPTGQLVRSVPLPSKGSGAGQMTVDTGDLPDGLYFLRLTEEGHLRGVKKVVKG